MVVASFLSVVAGLGAAASPGAVEPGPVVLTPPPQTVPASSFSVSATIWTAMVDRLASLEASSRGVDLRLRSYREHFNASVNWEWGTFALGIVQVGVTVAGFNASGSTLQHIQVASIVVGVAGFICGLEALIERAHAADALATNLSGRPVLNPKPADSSSGWELSP